MAELTQRFHRRGAGFDLNSDFEIVVVGKAGTVVEAVGQAVKEFKAGKIEFRNDAVGNLHAVMADHDDGDTRIWATEFGAPTGSGEDSVSPDEQAEILRDGINEQRRLPFVDKLFVYSLVDRGNAAADREQNFGIVDHDFDPKPAMAVVQRAASTPGCI